MQHGDPGRGRLRDALIVPVAGQTAALVVADVPDAVVADRGDHVPSRLGAGVVDDDEMPSAIVWCRTLSMASAR